MTIRSITVLAATATGLVFTGPVAVAGDYQAGTARHYAHFHGDASYAGGSGLPSRVRGLGTYAGGISAVRFRGEGVYFSADGGGAYLPRVKRPLRAGPRIIHVDRDGADARCSYEAGVCVIRP